ncbi:exopolysaccharide biosynthesis polyprenyl glycosylphosphotransferase [Solwaraspora sp. WMMD1047]|uniref:sugar transferase n=1 Tax=Solwaraspora sp. WMMD1047 TaxID=3016102 RepID=UPI002415CEB5|nr:exopolysaccharide biosynthesis polyprenyl glycosylphosphotransferase [Solwaraspora sp. WMMD1047]MDG4829859.1 exopolysaccharide biosynthesis polyprenyl glycosylphosphotransferase [Solwaraspora sp. WMMD1047]
METSSLPTVVHGATVELPIVAAKPPAGGDSTDRRTPAVGRPTDRDATADRPATAARDAIADRPATAARDAIADRPAPPVEHPAVGHPGAIPQQRAPERAESTATTTVLPYVGSETSRRTRQLRAWMLTAPVDLIALLGPLLWTRTYWRGTLVAAALTVTIFAAGGLYRARRHMSILDELPSLCGRLLAAASIVSIIAALRHDSVEYGAGFMRSVAISAGLVIVGRAVTRATVTFARRHRWVEHNAIILGSGPVAVELSRLLRRYPRYGLRFVGHVGVGPQRTDGPPVPLLATLDDLESTIPMVDCDVLIIADVEVPEPALMEVLRRPACVGCDLFVVPRLWGSRSQGGLPDHIGAIPVVQIRHTALSGPRWAVKRCSDLVFATVALVVLSPLLLLCALATLAEGGRGIFFYQDRVGRHGRPFKVIKFRTMRPHDEQESQTRWSIADDQRIGPVGRFMRRTSLDELPQLWNILRGDMTVVGPRPERPYFVEKFSAEHPDYAMRHRVPMGLTGLAQVSGLRGDTPISDRARFDNYYIENWSLWLDAKVLLRTIAEVFRGGGR